MCSSDLCWLFFIAKVFQTAFQIVDNISSLTFNLSQWQTILLGYKNVIFLMVFGFVWHFIPDNVINKLEKGFYAIPIYIKALLLGFVFWIVYATASSGPQPFIYFHF